ncbi:hypothetical protein U1Q18_017984 [Sarracenia purpurea var. burkii]
MPTVTTPATKSTLTHCILSFLGKPFDSKLPLSQHQFLVVRRLRIASESKTSLAPHGQVTRKDESLYLKNVLASGVIRRKSSSVADTST